MDSMLSLHFILVNKCTNHMYYRSTVNMEMIGAMRITMQVNTSVFLFISSSDLVPVRITIQGYSVYVVLKTLTTMVAFHFRYILLYLL